MTASSNAWRISKTKWPTSGRRRSLPGSSASFPTSPKSFLFPFVVDYHGQRFGKYPLGWPVVLALASDWVSGPGQPIPARVWSLADLSVGKTSFWRDGWAARRRPDSHLAFFLDELRFPALSSAWVGAERGFLLAWLDAFFSSYLTAPWLPALGPAVRSGLLALSRPFTAVAVGLPLRSMGLFAFRGDHRPG